MLHDVVASPICGLRGWRGREVLLPTPQWVCVIRAEDGSPLSRATACATQSQRLSAAELRALAETRPRRRVIGTSDDYTLMVSPGTVPGRYGEQSHSHATAESVPVPWSCFVESGKKQLLGE